MIQTAVAASEHTALLDVSSFATAAKKDRQARSRHAALARVVEAVISQWRRTSAPHALFILSAAVETPSIDTRSQLSGRIVRSGRQGQRLARVVADGSIEVPAFVEVAAETLRDVCSAVEAADDCASGCPACDQVGSFSLREIHVHCADEVEQNEASRHIAPIAAGSIQPTVHAVGVLTGDDGAV